NGKADGGFRGRDRQHQQREHLADDVAEMRRKRHEVDVDREQDQLDRHQYDDDVLAVEENAEDAKREQDRGDRKIMPKTDGHYSPCPGRTWRIAIAVSWVRATWLSMFWRLTWGLWRSVSTMAPTMATSSTMPAAWK